MSQKQELIKKMLEMQRKFIAYEHQHGVNAQDYFTPEKGHPLDQYRQEYMKMAAQVVDLAHQEKGSNR